jgi:hypothetical protein
MEWSQAKKAARKGERRKSVLISVGLSWSQLIYVNFTIALHEHHDLSLPYLFEEILSRI